MSTTIPTNTKIQMVDLTSQYQRIKSEVDQAIQAVLQSSQFINGPTVRNFEKNLAAFLSVKHVIGCGNGTDALQIAMMALQLERGDEIIVPAFTYVATAEVIALLGLTPVMVDVDPKHFNVTAKIIEAAITNRTKAIVPVHLFGQGAPMEEILSLAKKHQLFVIEDNAQAIGATYSFQNGHTQSFGTIGDIGTTSFYPAKNLGAYGDGGALFTNNDELAEKIRKIANHGQSKRYYHNMVGMNSRLDAIQAAILNTKLSYLDQYVSARQQVADAYDDAFKEIAALQIPYRSPYSTHVFHQYTLLVKDGRREALKTFLAEQGIPSMIYYPVPLYQQTAFEPFVPSNMTLPVTEHLCQSVLSLPIHTEMDQDTLAYIIAGVKSFF